MIATWRSKLAGRICVLHEEFVARWRLFEAGIRASKPFWRPLGLWLAFAFLALIPYLFPADLADQVRRSGMLFQFLGLATVTRGLMITRQKVFNKPPLWKGTAQSFGSFLRHLFKPPKPANAVGEAQAGAIALASFEPTVSTSSDNSLEHRVAKLETEMQDVRRRVSIQSRDVVHLRKEMEIRIDRESDERKTGDRDVSKQIEEAVIGGIHLELGGLAYLFLGILFTAVPQEMARLLQ